MKQGWGVGVGLNFGFGGEVKSRVGVGIGVGVEVKSRKEYSGGKRSRVGLAQTLDTRSMVREQG